MKISVSMIVLNEAKNIARALSSCSFADEIVIVDGGSTDRTLDILKGYPKAAIVHHPWQGDFGKQRQVCLDNCTGDWVIRLDADEAFSSEFEEKIRDLLDCAKDDVAGYKIHQCNLIGNENWYSRLYDDYEFIPRIWKRSPDVRWIGHIHEIIEGLNGRIVNWDAYVVHYGFLDKKYMWKKAEKYSQMQASGCNDPAELVYREYDIQPRPDRARISHHVPPYDLGTEDMGLSKLAIIRGPNLNKWEMQNYEPLIGQFNITAYSTDKPIFDLSKINIPIERLFSHPKNPAYMVGLEGAVFDKDLIYSADTTWLFSYQAAYIKKKFGKGLICLQWENIPFAYEESEGMRVIKEAVRTTADHFVAVTERAKDALIIEGVNSKKITVIPMGIDIERFKPDRSLGCGLRKELKIGEDELVVLFTGRLVWEKGIYDFIYSAKLIQVQYPQLSLRFVVVGKGPEGDRVRQQIKELGIEDHFILINDYPYHEMHKMYNMADIFVLPSISTRQWKEQFGMVLIEAMACGVPVISTTSGSIPEVVGDAGVLVQANDPKALSDAMLSLIKDDAKTIEFSQKGRERAVKEFNSREIAKRFGGLFDTVLKGMQENKTLSDNSSDRETIEIFSEFGINGKGQGKDSCITNKEMESNHVSGTTAEGVDANYYRQGRNEVACLVPTNAKMILDVGCGEGILGKNLLDKGAKEVVGIEVNSSVAKKAQENISSVICGDVDRVEMPFAKGYFDCIIFADVLEHLKEPLSTLKRFKDYLSDSGVIVASIPNVRHYSIINMLAEGSWKYGDYGILDRTHLRFFTRKEMEKIFQDAGLEITAIMENLSPVYNTLKVSGLNEIEFGRIKIKNLKQDEIRDLFVIQYIIRAKKVLAVYEIESKTPLILKKEIEEHLKHHPLDLDMLYKYAEVCREIGLSDESLKAIDKILLFEPERQEAVKLRESIVGWVGFINPTNK